MSVSIRDVAREAGVSVGTVSNALNDPDRVAPGTLQRIAETIERLGFVRNDAARQLRAGRSKAVGLIVLDGANPFFAELALGAERRADEFGLSVLVANADEDPQRERILLNLFEEQRVFGVLISPLVVDVETLRKLRDRGTPVVLVDLTSEDKSFSSVSVDDFAGGKFVVQHMVDRGCRKIAFVGGPLIRNQVAERLSGARAAAESADLELTVVETLGMTVDEGRAIGEKLVKMPKDQRPDAVFAANDLLALGIMQAVILDGQLSIPGDLAIVGYDDIPFASTAIVPLSTVRQSPALIGSTAIELLYSEAQNESDAIRQLVIQPELVIRESSLR
ncbi:MAG: LacI family DNA-binding transcriptional regulator [Actinomycetales bacterium]|nr:LacI family DNA-binding transcriptional regulator [Actinomycetales bacterium]